MSDSKINYYFTFCLNHPQYSNTTCRVSVDNGEGSYGKAREKFVAKFGTRWAFQYSEESYNRSIIPGYDQKIVDIDDLPYVDPTPVDEDKD